MFTKKLVITIFCISFFLLPFFSVAQNFNHAYIKEYFRLESKDKDSTEAFCNNLIYKGNIEERIFGLAGKAYVNTLKGN